MKHAERVQRTVEFIRNAHAADSSGHDWWHIWRVWQMARRLASEERADLDVVDLAALLHDVADWKFHDGDEDVGPRKAREWLSTLETPAPVIDHVAEIIAAVSFKGAGVATPMKTLEGRCVQDADRLDAIGAIGIARAFAYGGSRGRLLYDPEMPPEAHESFAAYKRNAGPTINHFHEKLLLLKDRMQTEAGRREAAERHAFMEDFLRRFHAEWNGAGSPADL